MYAFMTLDDNTNVVHSEMKSDGTVKVYFEQPIYQGFKSAECYLPQYEWKNINGFSEKEIERFDEFVHSLAHIIIELSQDGGFDNAANL